MVANRMLASSTTDISETRIAEHKVEVVRLRAEIGDPAEALPRWVRETFDYRSLLETSEELMAGQTGLDDENWSGG